MSEYMTPTAETYGQLQRAFDHFNERLFQMMIGSRLATADRHHPAVLGKECPANPGLR